ncbi:MAG: molecular chaperone DnaK, partial [Actinobacteria bacterium]|nr:molecular chaperone DnaK [Actinomycetota bacterium]
VSTASSALGAAMYQEAAAAGGDGGEGAPGGDAGDAGSADDDDVVDAEIVDDEDEKK